MGLYPKFEVPAKVAVYTPDLTQVILAKYRDYDGCFGLPGGHINHGEQPDEALKREVFEELGFPLPDNTSLRETWSSGPDKEKNLGPRLVLAYTAIRESLELPEPPTSNEVGVWMPLSQLNQITSLDPRYRDFIYQFGGPQY